MKTKTVYVVQRRYPQISGNEFEQISSYGTERYAVKLMNVLKLQNPGNEYRIIKRTEEVIE